MGVVQGRSCKTVFANISVVARVTCYSATLMHPNLLISSHSDDGWLHQPVCQEYHTYNVCLFPLSSTVCSSLKEEDITLLCESWCRYLKFLDVSSVTEYFPQQPQPLSCEFPNNRSSIDKVYIAHSQFHIQHSYTKKRQRQLQADFPSSAETLSSLMPSVKLEILAQLLHICCASVLKARDGTGKINRGYDGRRTAMNNRLFLLLCIQIYGG